MVLEEQATDGLHIYYMPSEASLQESFMSFSARFEISCKFEIRSNSITKFFTCMTYEGKNACLDPFFHVKNLSKI